MSVSSHLAMSLQHVTCVFQVCPRRCISVTSGAGSQWLILSSGGCLAHWEESSQNRRWAPVTGLPDQGSPPTLSQRTHTHTQKRAHMSWQNACTCMHAQAKVFTHKRCHSNTLSVFIYPFWPSLHLSPPLLSLYIYCTTSLLVFHCLLSFPDQWDSCSH